MIKNCEQCYKEKNYGECNHNTHSNDWLKAKYHDIQPYLKTVELREKIDELFNWFSTKVMETEVTTGLRGFDEVMKERKRIVELIKKNDNRYHAGYYCVEEKIINSLLFHTSAKEIEVDILMKYPDWKFPDVVEDTVVPTEVVHKIDRDEEMESIKAFIKFWRKIQVHKEETINNNQMVEEYLKKEER